MLIALFGAANVLLVDAATFAVSAISIAVGVPSAARGGTAPVQGKRGYLPELLKGLRFVRTNTLILSMILVATVTNFLDIPLVSVVLPVYAKTFYGSPTSLGTMVGALAGGGAGRHPGVRGPGPPPAAPPDLRGVLCDSAPGHLWGTGGNAPAQCAGLAGIPLGTALVGFVLQGVGLVPTILGMGAIYLAVTLGMSLNPVLRQMDARRPPAAERRP